MFRGMVAGTIAVALGLLLSSSALVAHEGYPITVKADYREIGRGGSVKRMIFVTGHAHYPDGTRMAIGLRYEGQQQYVSWYNTTVMKQGFVAEIGPFTKALSPGQYVIEAWFNWERQSEPVKAEIMKADANVEGGGISEKNAKCRPEVLAAKKDCLSRNVVGACVIMVGTPNQYQMEDIKNIELLQQALGEIEKLMDELRGEVKKHLEAKNAKTPPAAGTTPATKESWQEWGPGWLGRVDAVDQVLSQWKQSRLVQKDSDSYSDMVNVLLKMRELWGQWGGKLYALEGGGGLIGGDVDPTQVNPEATDKEIETLINGVPDDTQHPGVKKKLVRDVADAEKKAEEDKEKEKEKDKGKGKDKDKKGAEK